jgi:3-dehydroquinate synthase
LRDDDLQRIVALFRRAKLPTDAPDLGVDRYLDLMGLDKKVEHGQLRLVLLERLGSALVTAEFPRDLLERVLEGPIYTQAPAGRTARA